MATTKPVVDRPITSRTLEVLDEALNKLDSLLKPGQAVATQHADVSAPVTPASQAPAAAAAPAQNPAEANKPAVEKKEKKQAAAPAAAVTAAAGSSDVATLFQKVLIKVARVMTVDLVENSEKLYKLTVDVGAGEIRQVCAGLRQYLSPEQLQGVLVTAVCNLKPAKLAGNLSEAMLLAAETEPAAGGLVVRLLLPPPGSEPGEQVFVQGGVPSSDTPKQLKSDHWKPVAAVLRVEGGGMATVAGTPLVTGKGFVTLPPEIPDGSAIH